MKQLSIRWRITLWNTAGFAVVLLGFGLAVYGMLRKTHYDQLDRGLSGRVLELQRDLTSAESTDAKIRAWVTKLEQHQGVTASVTDADGARIARSPTLPDSAIPPTADAHELRQSVVLPELGHVRRFSTSVVAGDRTYRILLLKDLSHVDEEMQEVVTALAIAAPIAVGLAAALAYVLARKSLAPVEQLRRTTDEITAHNLHRRLSIDNPHDELGLLATTINAMIARLERSFGEMQRFTADASHELRTPIAVVRSESEMGLQSGTMDDAKSRFASVLEECERVAWMTDQLLTLAREDAGIAVPKREQVDLAALVIDVVDTMRPFASAKDQTLSVSGCDEKAWVLGDAERLRQVLRNLLTNALRYTEAGGRIEVELVRRDDETVLKVRDTGVGIAPEHLPLIFDRFYRVDSARTQQDGGAGLGLSIVKSIVTAHGGRIDVTSTPGQGSEFLLFLPTHSRGK